MIRFTTKAILTAALALFTFVATAPTASADSGQLDVNNSSFALNNFTISGHSVDASFQFGSDAWVLLFEGAFGDLKTLSIVSDGTTYTFSGVGITNAGWDLWKGGLNIDFKFDKVWSSNAAVPEPSTVLLIGCGLLALAIVSSRKLLRA
jgi:PEP-CTERM motif